jgi:uncharacterized membrane protein
MKRYASIDVARTLAIFMMFICHFTIFLSSHEGGQPLIYFFGDHIIGDEVAPLFVFLVGLSFFVSSEGIMLGADAGRRVIIRSLLRGAAMFVLGLIYMRVVWGYDELFGWDVLTLIAFSVALLPFVRKLRTSEIVMFAIFIVFISPVLRHNFGYPRFWEGDDYSPPFTFAQTFGGFFLNGYFPVFPWLAYVLFGYSTGRVMYNDNAPLKSSSVIPLVSVLLMAFGFGGAMLNNYVGIRGPVAFYFSYLEFYPFTTTLFAIGLSFCLIVVWFLRTRMDGEGCECRCMTFFNRYSRYSLSAYVIHFMLIIFVPRMIGYFTKGDDYFYYRNITSSLYGLTLSVVFFFALYPVLVLWDKVGGKFSFEWLVRKCYAWV